MSGELCAIPSAPALPPLHAVAPDPLLHAQKPLILWSSAGEGFPHTALCSGAVYSPGIWFYPALAAWVSENKGPVSDLAITTSHSRITTTIISKETGTHARIFYVISHIRRFSRDFAAYF